MATNPPDPIHRTPGRRPSPPPSVHLLNQILYGPRRLVSANFENASRIRAFGLRSYFRTRRGSPYSLGVDLCFFFVITIVRLPE